MEKFFINDGVKIKEEQIIQEEYISFLKRMNQGLQYLKERFEERIAKFVNNITISLIARNEMIAA